MVFPVLRLITQITDVVVVVAAAAVVAVLIQFIIAHVYRTQSIELHDGARRKKLKWR